MADGGGLSLSGLPDVLLQRILYFAPAKEAASTAVLSRRWRSLWRTSGAVNVDSRSYRHFARHQMEVALAAAEGPVRKITLHVQRFICEIDKSINSNPIWGRDGSSPNLEMLAELLSSPAAASGAVEELRFVIADDQHLHSLRREVNPHQAVLRFGDLPSESLRTLHVTNVPTLTPPPPGAVFPRLADLQLRRCGVSSLADLRRILAAAPQVDTLHLDCHYYIPYQHAAGDIGAVPACCRIHCPAVTALVFEAACWSWPWKEVGLELDVPRLQHFRYRGLVHIQNRLSLKLLESTNLVRADLHFVRHDYSGEQVRVPFWEFIQIFNVAKVLKLKLDFETHHVAVVDRDDKLLSNRLFSNLERLELELQCEPTTDETTTSSSALFIANLLRCCPVLRHLRLKLTKAPRKTPTRVQPLSDFNKSIDHFKNYKRPKTIVLSGDDGNHEVSDIPGLSNHSFECLRSYLRTVSLQFWMEEPNCFGVQLAKFFAENAVVLEEISIDDGNHKMCEHMNRMLRRWVPSSRKRKNSPSATAFRESYSMKRQKKELTIMFSAVNEG